VVFPCIVPEHPGADDSLRSPHSPAFRDRDVRPVTLRI
jgi:hypothetical protein